MADTGDLKCFGLAASARVFRSRRQQPSPSPSGKLPDACIESSVHLGACLVARLSVGAWLLPLPLKTVMPVLPEEASCAFRVACISGPECVRRNLGRRKSIQGACCGGTLPQSSKEGTSATLCHMRRQVSEAPAAPLCCVKSMALARRPRAKPCRGPRANTVHSDCPCARVLQFVILFFIAAEDILARAVDSSQCVASSFPL